MRPKLSSVTSAAVLAMGAIGVGGSVAAGPHDAPMTWFLTCSLTESGRTEPIMGGRLFVGAFDGKTYASELVGPVANSYDNAVDAAHVFSPIYGDWCEPTPADEVWMINLPYCHPARAAAGRALPGC